MAFMLLAAVARPLAGVGVLSHDHHDLGAHTHVVSTFAMASGSDGWHVDGWHADEHQHHDLPSSEHGTLPLEYTGVVIIAYAPNESVPARASATPLDLVMSMWTAAAGWCLHLPPADGPIPGSPGGSICRGPRHLRALTASDRLIATSRALLI
jgi:hypothetical protein